MSAHLHGRQQAPAPKTSLLNHVKTDLLPAGIQGNSEVKPWRWPTTWLGWIGFTLHWTLGIAGATVLVAGAVVHAAFGLVIGALTAVGPSLFSTTQTAVGLLVGVAAAVVPILTHASKIVEFFCQYGALIGAVLPFAAALVMPQELGNPLADRLTRLTEVVGRLVEQRSHRERPKPSNQQVAIQFAVGVVIGVAMVVWIGSNPTSGLALAVCQWIPLASAILSPLLATLVQRPFRP